jgi:hypothetical protein
VGLRPGLFAFPSRTRHVPCSRRPSPPGPQEARVRPRALERTIGVGARGGTPGSDRPDWERGRIGPQTAPPYGDAVIWCDMDTLSTAAAAAATAPARSGKRVSHGSLFRTSTAFGSAR